MTTLDAILAALLILAVMGLAAVAMGWVELSASLRTPPLAKRRAARAAQAPAQAQAPRETGEAPAAVPQIGRAS